MTTIARHLAATFLVALLGLSAAAAAPSQNGPVDIIEDRPSMISNALGAVADVGYWAWDKVSSVVSVVLPPSPTSLSKTVDAEDSSELLKLLGYAGYKLKEIDNQVGVIPTIAFKFALTRELSEADWEYLDYRLAVSRFNNAGLGFAIQRAIVESVMTVNTGGAYQVSELKVQLLPLPKVAFSVTPKVSTLNEENSTLMRAIQRMEKRLRGDIAKFSGQFLPGRVLHKYIVMHEWLAGLSVALFAVALLFEIRRQLRPAASGRQGPKVSLAMLGGAALLWSAYAAMPLSLLALAGGLGLIGLTALITAGKSASQPQPAPAAGAEAFSPPAPSSPDPANVPPVPEMALT